ncbi:MAG: aldo/keto reductase [Muribaculum sp.]|nr:aldo/keto reductase [Muribaculaceae bacterium]MCM1080617.1 aldo/keto reductase [Muribaculum sp.]
MVEPIYSASETRYDNVKLERCGKSGILLPKISLGFWHNFGATSVLANCKNIVRTAFDNGIVSLDLANNYGPPYGTAEETFGKILRDDFRPYRDELFIATKAGYDMWPGPYGNWGSRKYLMASIDQSLKRMGLEYVDVFYSHRYDPATPLDETLMALVDIVRSGKALYVGLSRWPREAEVYGFDFLEKHGCHCLLFQDRLNIFDREAVESGKLQAAVDNGVGFVAFSPLAQGLLTNRYINGIPEGSRATKSRFLQAENITPEMVERIKRLSKIAANRGQSLAQMAVAWVLAHPGVTSAIVGASSPEQLLDTIASSNNMTFTSEELNLIDTLQK